MCNVFVSRILLGDAWKFPVAQSGLNIQTPLSNISSVSVVASFCLFFYLQKQFRLN